MKAIVQPWLPQVKVEKIKRDRKSPQPKLARFQTVKKYEIMHRPFDLKFRGRINKWLARLTEKDVKIHKLLDRKSYQVIRAYFFHQGEKKVWLTQDQVADKIPGINKYKLRNRIVDSLMKIWEENK